MGLFSFLGPKKAKAPATPQSKVVVAGKGDPAVAEAKAVEMFAMGVMDVKDIIAPPAIEIDFNNMLIGGKYFRTFFATGFPRWVGAN